MKNTSNYTAYNIINGSRFRRMITVEVYQRWKMYFLSGLMVAGLLLVYSFLRILGSNPVSGSECIFFFRLNLFVGIIVASTVFDELNTPAKATSYLMIPASTEEKFLSKLLLSTLFYLLYTAAVIFVASLAGASLAYLHLGTGFSLFNPVAEETLSVLGGFIFFHSIFFFGAVFFKRMYFFKTILAIIAMGVIATFLMIVTLSVLGRNVDPEMLNTMFQSLFSNHAENLIRFLSVLRDVLAIAMPAVLYVWAYVRFRRKEVRG